MSRFDDLAATWDSVPARREAAAGVAAAMKRAVPFAPHWTVLDYGAGTGLLTLQIEPLVARAFAVDASSGMLDALHDKLAAAGLTKVVTQQADLQTADWDGPPVDAVVSSLTLHHLADVPGTLRRLVAALRPGGWLAVADLDQEDGSFHGPDVPDVHHLGFARSTISDWLVAAGCAEVTVADAHRFAKPDAAGHLREYDVFLATGRRPE